MKGSVSLQHHRDLLVQRAHSPVSLSVNVRQFRRKLAGEMGTTKPREGEKGREGMCERGRERERERNREGEICEERLQQNAAKFPTPVQSVSVTEGNTPFHTQFVHWLHPVPELL